MANDNFHATRTEYHGLLQQLTDCALTCEACATACLNEENVSMMARCIELDRDCADICSLGARLIQRDAEIADTYLSLCATMCRMCAEECAKHNDEHCKRCASVCQATANACDAVAAE
jgi:hypothetical protein